MKKERNITVDLLRGASMLFVLFLHALVPYLGNPVVFRIWDFARLEVPAFLACSAYLFYLKAKKGDVFFFSFPYTWKRVLRLYIPYAFFMVFFFTIVFFTHPERLTSEFLLKSALLIGGIDINWLILLFVQMIPLFPAISYLYRKLRPAFWAFAVAAFGSAVYLFFYDVPVDYRWIMWLPWSTVAITSLLFVEHTEKILSRKWLIAGAVVCINLLLFWWYFSVYGKIDLRIHKYPPDILFLTYGLVTIIAALFLFQLTVFQKGPVSRFLQFMSVYSFELFFIHYIVIYLLQYWKFHTWMGPTLFFISVAVLSVFVQVLILHVQKLVIQKRIVG